MHDVAYYALWLLILYGLHIHPLLVSVILIVFLFIAFIQKAWSWFPWSIGVFIILLFQTFSSTVLRDGTILLARTSYVLIHVEGQTLYLRQPQTIVLEKGDRLVIPSSFSTSLIRTTTYEGNFDFTSYLNERGVDEELHLSNIEIAYRTWYRPTSWRQHLVHAVDPSLQSWMSMLLFDESLPHAEPIFHTFSISGIGLWSFLWVLERFLMPITTATTRRLFLLGLMVPYGVLMGHHFAIFRVVVFFSLRMVPPHPSHRWIRRYSLLGFWLWQPWSYRALGVTMYLAYKMFYGWMYRILQPRSLWIKTSVIYGWMILLSSLLFHEINFLQPILFMVWSVLYPILIIFLLISFLIPFLQIRVASTFASIASLWEQISTMVPPLYLRSIPWVLMILLLSFGMVWVYAKRYHVKPVKKFTGWAMLIILVSTQLPIETVFHPFRIHFLNVGQGDATFIQYRGKTILIDTGGHPQKDIAKDVLIPYFYRQAVFHLDYVFITHEDFDHVGALPSLMQHFSVGAVIRHLPSPLVLGHLQIENLNFWRDEMEEENDRSLILSIRYQSCHTLIMGDAPVAIEERLIGLKMIQHLNILRLGHHGSLTSTSDAFLDWTRPDAIIISLGGGNRYGHPHPNVIERLEKRSLSTYRTDYHGTIVAESCKINL